MLIPVDLSNEAFKIMRVFDTTTCVIYSMSKEREKETLSLSIWDLSPVPADNEADGVLQYYNTEAISFWDQLCYYPDLLEKARHTMKIFLEEVKGEIA